MGLLKTAIVGAAIYAGIKYITKKDPITGKSVIDDLKDKKRLSGWEKAKDYKSEFETRASYAKDDLGI